MGVYVYGLQPHTREAQLRGVRVTVGQLQFAYKPSPSSEEFNRRCEREVIGPLRKAWRGKKRPAYVVRGDWDNDGPQEVFRWPRGWVSCEDDPNFGRTVRLMGHLVNGTIVPLSPALTPSRIGVA